MMASIINSRDWWDQYFSDKWDKFDGRNQTHYFSSILVSNIPYKEFSFLTSQELKVLDWGCAFGDGVNLFQSVFINTKVTGLDFSKIAIDRAKELFPENEFIWAADGEILDKYDVVITSNCLEHFTDFLEVACKHLESCKKLYLVLVPFNEFPLHEQHVSSFNKATFPEMLNGFKKIYQRAITTLPNYWNGSQLLTIYASSSYLEEQIYQGGNRGLFDLVNILSAENEKAAIIINKQNDRYEKIFSDYVILFASNNSRFLRKFSKVFLNFQNRVIPRGSKREQLIKKIIKLSDNVRTKGFSHTAIKIIDKRVRRVKNLLAFQNIRKNNFPTSFDIIVFPIIDWDFRLQRPQHLAENLSKLGHRVFYFKTTFSKGNFPEIRKITESIFEIVFPGPQSYSIYSSDISDDLLDSFTEGLIYLTEKFTIRDAVCIVDFPYWTKLALFGKTQFSWKIIYDCMDLYKDFENITPLLKNEEDVLSNSSDIIVTTSHLLFQNLSKFSTNIHLIPNACDFDLFSKQPKEFPHELMRIKNPIIGYFGAISNWFDVDLLYELSRSNPDWNFVLIGAYDEHAKSSLEGLSNIYLLGEKNYYDLPKYLYAFNVCIIPFKKNQLTDATNPVKLFEYLSAGKPIIATRLKELADYSGFVRFGYDTSSWTTQITQALQVEPRDVIEKRIEFAKLNTWNYRAKELIEYITELYPKVSIIMVCYNNVDLTRKCIESIYKKTAYPCFETIIVDNASSDGTREYLKQIVSIYPNIELILNSTNVGFAPASNQGAFKAKGEILVFLNNDTIVSYGWIGLLLRHLQSDPRIGEIGPVTNAIGNEARVKVNYSHIKDIDSFASERYIKYCGKCFEVDSLALFCTMIYKKLFFEVGGLDERFQVGMFEDDDLSIRIKKAGYKVVCAEDVFIHHFHGAAFNKLNNVAYTKIFEQNKLRFEEKWGIEWKMHKYRG